MTFSKNSELFSLIYSGLFGSLSANQFLAMMYMAGAYNVLFLPEFLSKPWYYDP